MYIVSKKNQQQTSIKASHYTKYGWISEGGWRHVQAIFNTKCHTVPALTNFYSSEMNKIFKNVYAEWIRFRGVKVLASFECLIALVLLIIRLLLAARAHDIGTNFINLVK